jgi:sporulation protein YlmC with PRC-barrel domain
MSATAFTTSGAAVSETFREARVEELLGKKLCDSDGHKVGRIEELIAELRGTDLVVVEVHLGRGALLERLGELSTLVPLFGGLQRRLERRIRVPWHQLDLTDPDHPRATVRRAELQPTSP